MFFGLQLQSSQGREGLFTVLFFVFSQFSRSVVSDSATPWIAAHQASLSITNSQSLFKLMSIESVMPFSHLILCRSLLLLPPIPTSIGSFPMSQLFASGGKSIGVSASASVLPMNAQDWCLRPSQKGRRNWTWITKRWLTFLSLKKQRQSHGN